MNNKEIIRKYWEEFLMKSGKPENLKYYFCGYMGPTEKIANELLHLILTGTKTATTSCLLSYGAENEPIPQIGSLSIVTDWNGNPGCVIETTNVTIMPFSEMTFEICKREGEDDNLESWQNIHFNIFKNEGKELGFTFTEDTKIVFEDFKVIYK